MLIFVFRVLIVFYTRPGQIILDRYFGTRNQQQGNFIRFTEISHGFDAHFYFLDQQFLIYCLLILKIATKLNYLKKS